MTLRGDSFGSVSGVAAYSRYLLQGKATFTADTAPTVTEVEGMIDRVSGVLNIALRGVGFNPSSIYANSTAKLLCDDWVVSNVAVRVELTQPGMGFNDSDRTRTGGFSSLHKRAAEFAKENAMGFKYAGIAVARATSAGLAFTGLVKDSERADPTDPTIEQPIFKRHQFDAEGGG